AAVAMVLPVAALADPATSADKANGARACKTLKASMGATAFSSTYATFGKCVSAWTRAEHQNRHEASAACEAEQADVGFPAAHDGKTFAQFYGVGKRGANALNRCTQAKAKAASAAERQATVKAAKQCKAERSTLGAEAFKAKYGIGAKKANAFGKCVSKLARA
ncbi:MAG TPA: hypothetical protein VNP93_06030, partial [Gaiellaceae bacterium]|nr:hypothetical protein [Gaiellaceae bacterium]